MAENKIIAIHRSDAEIGCAGRMPLILNFHDFKQMAPQSEPNGSLIGAISGIAFDAHFAHRCPPWPNRYTASVLRFAMEVSLGVPE